MKSAICLLLAAAGLFAADEDPWAKVRALKQGVEVRIYQANVAEPVNAKLDRTTEESVIVVTRNEQTSILRSEIDRIDCRSSDAQAKDAPRVDRKVERKGAELSANTIPGATTQVSVPIRPKPGFETVYRRPQRKP